MTNSKHAVGQNPVLFSGVEVRVDLTSDVIVISRITHLTGNIAEKQQNQFELVCFHWEMISWFGANSSLQSAFAQINILKKLKLVLLKCADTNVALDYKGMIFSFIPAMNLIPT